MNNNCKYLHPAQEFIRGGKRAHENSDSEYNQIFKRRRYSNSRYEKDEIIEQTRNGMENDINWYISENKELVSINRELRTKVDNLKDEIEERLSRIRNENITLRKDNQKLKETKVTEIKEKDVEIQRLLELCKKQSKDVLDLKIQ